MARQQATGSVRALVFLLVAGIAGIAAILLLSRLIDSYTRQIETARKPEDKVMVFVAARDLYQGVTITEEDLYAVEIPTKYLPDDPFFSAEHVVGRIPRERILANEIVRADRLSDPESGIGLNAVIPRGMRAMSIDVRDAEALSGFLNPLNYVDVLVTVRPPDDERPPETRTLLQAVFVLGVNSRMAKETKEEARERRGPQRPSVTLLVTAEQAEQLAHAMAVGEVRLSLRNDLDINFSVLEGGTNIDDLRRQLQKLSSPSVRSGGVRSSGGTLMGPKSTLEIIRGDQKSELEINADGTVDPNQRGRRR